MEINSKTYKVKEVNRYKTKSVKTQIVLATSLRKKNHHITRLQHKDYGKTKRWNTYTISRDGTIYQHYDDKYHSDFLGVKEGDRKSISIVLENMGALFETEDNQFVNWLNECCDKELTVGHEWGGYTHWEAFTDAQMKSVAELCSKLCKTHNIPKKCFETHHHHKNISKFKGIVFRSNHIEDSSDTHPLFDIEKFSKMLNNESD
jgi:N-acetyl-anhydromuramyl-L-alanine amidase AmpD